MAEEIFDHGKVTRVQGEMAFVEIPPNEYCEHCGAKIICASDERGERGLLVRNPLGAKVGQEVLVTQSHNVMLRLSLMQYGLPLLGFLLGIFSLYWIPLSVAPIPIEVVYFCAGLVGLGIGGWISWNWAKKAGNKANMYFEISKIYNGKRA